MVLISNSNKQSVAFKTLMVMALVVIVASGLKVASSIIVPFFLSLFISIILFPAVQFLVRRKVPSVVAVLFVVFITLSTLPIIFAVIGKSVGEFSSSLPKYQGRFLEISDSLSGWIEETGISIPKKTLREHINLAETMQLFANMLAELGGVLTNALFIIFSVVFILLESSDFPFKIRQAFPNSKVILQNLNSFSSSLKSYMIIKTIISILTGITVSILLAILGVDFYGLFGMVAFLLNYIPTIGSIIAAVPAVLLSFVQIGGTTSLFVAIGFIVINVFYGNVIEPRYMGKGLGLSTFVVFISLVFWGWLFGLVGSLLSVPLTMTLKIALESSKETKWIAILLGSEQR